ncbi:aromatic amino acid lyase, partial [Staphylococcus aureus]|uniref:aromatic amino acid lyase n=1 Tax=Staphylococcus aureus TaxID=1280 RepID=UPI00164250D4
QLFNYLKHQLQFQINPPNHNPLIFHQPNQTFLISPPNFHPQPIPFPLHHLKLPLTQLPNLSQPPLHQLLTPQLNPHLPPFLTPHPPFQTPPIIIQYPPAT